ncbi:uncharacterized protein SPPG_00842 [Spizellomyces punctatus DAOM BR117]|uniref:C2H2-type domain-containing protein n=1 Tax=Spizellomyces punctatus (strain DAOM BR117) TaxID=645134 RepID=A0A0L0HW90_SPIPD|nr:uncharacterized protein SPPG_00842 [Spizellomyces punctatus DAOM BR117]KND05175.1 hypothetical protein SPPG_00842 [Spizellomyces punctatus DAOM BR117]|eukprot:XP_016613214.1 hypothetical protein SPPG_00842 [Spizellomyces punctatus DAOM BR117]
MAGVADGAETDQQVDASMTDDVGSMDNTVISTVQQRRYKCSDCNLSFRRTEHLVRHQLTHSGEKPYPCTICCRGFSRMDALQRHYRIHSFRPNVVIPSASGEAPNSSEAPSPHVLISASRSRTRPYPALLPSPRPSVSMTSESSPSSVSLSPSKSIPVRGPVICPARLRELASAAVVVVANGDRALYQCPVKGCKTLLTSHHLSHHLEARRHAHEPEKHSQGCTAIGTRDLVTFVDHIYSRHAMQQFCRDCKTDHTRGDYYSVENAPCVIPACHDPLESAQVELSRSSLHAVLAGSIQAPSPKSATDSDDASLLTLAHCAAQELARAPQSIDMGTIWDMEEENSGAKASEAHRFRIQDLLN